MEVSPYSFYCVSKNACPTALSGPECEDYQVECQNFRGTLTGYLKALSIAFLIDPKLIQKQNFFL